LIFHLFLTTFQYKCREIVYSHQSFWISEKWSLLKRVYVFIFQHLHNTMCPPNLKMASLASVPNCNHPISCTIYYMAPIKLFETTMDWNVDGHPAKGDVAQLSYSEDWGSSVWRKVEWGICVTFYWSLRRAISLLSTRYSTHIRKQKYSNPLFYWILSTLP